MKIDINELCKPENAGVFSDFTERVFQNISGGLGYSFQSMQRNTEAAEHWLNMSEKTPEHVKAFECTMVLHLANFWLKHKEDFLKLDRILAHCENLPLKDKEK